MNQNKIARLKLLIVDDDETSRILITEILIDEPIDIVESRNGKEALYLYEKFSKELVLVFLDIKLPDCCGWELINQLRSKNTLVPIIALSATSPKELEDKTKSSGFTSYLSKPFDIDNLIQIVNFYTSCKVISV